MHGIAKRGLALAAAASGLVLGTAGIAAASASATGETAQSGGIASGNVIEVPVSAPINVCGDQVLVGAAHNDVGPSTCSNGGGDSATAQGSTLNSGGILSGNVIEAPVATALNLCGNQVGLLAVDNLTEGSVCTNS
jgi:hypothetical protein